MRRTGAFIVLALLAAAPLGAQGRDDRDRGRDDRDRGRRQGVPPGHLPPPGQCRVWYDDLPPGQQPAPTSCREAERVASRDRYARVIYGSDARSDRWGDRDDRIWREGDDRRSDRPRAIPRGDRDRDRRYPETYPYPDRGRYPGSRIPDRGSYGNNDVAFDNGYRDGYDKGLEDLRDGDRYDLSRHERYRSADRGYDRRYGTKDEYREIYRDGFRSGYDEAFYERGGYGRDPRDRGNRGIRLPWPF